MVLLFKVLVVKWTTLDMFSEQLLVKKNENSFFRIIFRILLKCKCMTPRGYLWHHDLVVITAAQLHSTKPELRFCAVSSPAHGVSEIQDGEDL